ncbi:serine hydrolase domain-containing protein [Taibaiella koreensis]|uniref:serine hydrolase domain-containing protein n=1 Tax=Taibaiella koreensis TaxID=1268548 RepID=UPI000E59BB5B|nr:serine hydrolase [Taibaiella koreensis]
MRPLFRLLCCCLPAATFAQAAPDPLQLKTEQSLHSEALPAEGTILPAFTIHQRMLAQKVNGLSIAVIDQGRLAWAKGYGVADASAPGIAVDTATLFQCASIGKVVTALAALHLVKTGALSLDQPVNRSLTGWKIPTSGGKEEKVTLRHLLSHTAGLDDEYGFEGYTPHSMLPDMGQMLDSKTPANTKKKLIVKHEPGTEEKYSGGGFLIVQKLIEDASGQSFPRYVDSLIFKPLKMQHSTYSYYPDEDLHQAIARGHDEEGKVD